jgi:hypothetical protein
LLIVVCLIQKSTIRLKRHTCKETFQKG